MENANAVPLDGAGGDGELDNPIIPQPATSAKGNSIEGYGCERYRRAHDLSIAAGLLAKWNPPAREFSIIRSSWADLDDPDSQLFMLMIERTAPSAECADPLWFRALTREEDTAAIVAARVAGWMPPELIEDAAAAFAAVVHGRLRVKGVNHAA